MSELRVILDLVVPEGGEPLDMREVRELVHHLAQAIDVYRQEQGPLEIVALKVPDAHQSFVEAPDLFHRDRFERWQQARLPVAPEAPPPGES